MSLQTTFRQQVPSHYKVNEITGMEEKWCPECESWKPAFKMVLGGTCEGFNRSDASPDGLQTHCIQCKKIRVAGVGRAKYRVTLYGRVHTFRSNSKAHVFLWRARVEARAKSGQLSFEKCYDPRYLEACAAKIERME